MSEKQIAESFFERKISVKRKRKLQKLGIICWWSAHSQSWVWDKDDMADPSHLREGLKKYENREHGRRKL